MAGTCPTCADADPKTGKCTKKRGNVDPAFGCPLWKKRKKEIPEQEPDVEGQSFLFK